MRMVCKRWLRRRARGASGLTYGILVGLVAVVAIAAISQSGGAVNALFGTVSLRLRGATPPAAPAAPAAPSLYPFTSHSFTTCGFGGRTGPDELSCETAYGAGFATNNAYFRVVSGIQQWTVPADGAYRITARGARGAASNSQTSGGAPGAEVVGTFTLTQGQILHILVGQTPTTADGGGGGGGGGGSFVALAGTTPLIVAGGGGGAGAENGTTDLGRNGGPGDATLVTTSAGGSSPYTSGGGAGWSNDGAVPANNSSYNLTTATSFQGGGAGGNGGTGVWQEGGFGGGGAGADSFNASGGGGGYRGGNAPASNWDDHARGGQSFNSGTSPSGTSGANLGPGTVLIERL